MAMYFEDLKVGEVYLTRGRTITEADIMLYAGLCWDTQVEHTNAEFARRGPFGERIAQQQLGLLVAHGLLDSLRLTEKTLISVMRLSWNFINPIRIGDTLHLKVKILNKRELDSGDQGLVTLELETINQHAELVNRIQRTIAVAGYPVLREAQKTLSYVFRGLSELENTASRTSEQVAATTQLAGKVKRLNRGKYFEEFEIGEELITQARTVAELDSLNYTLLSWDTDPLHTDSVYGEATSFGGLLAPLLMPIIFANGLGATLGFLAGTNRGALGDWWEFVRPVRVGDTLYFRQVIIEKRDAKDSATGIVTFRMEMINQDGEVVSWGERSALVARLPEVEDEVVPWNFVFGTPEGLARG